MPHSTFKCVSLASWLSLGLWLTAPAHAQSAAPAASPATPTLVNPVLDSDAKANLKAIAATQARLTALLKLGTPLSLAAAQPEAGSNYQKDYIWAKAQRWLDVAQDEVRNNNRSTFPQAALAQSQVLIALLEAGDSPAGLQAGWDTPHLAQARTVRDDLWTPLLLWKQLALAGAPVAQAGARCALATSGYTEVQLVWAGWVGTHYGWRSALPYISHAERSFDQAQAQFVACRDAAALSAEPAKTAPTIPTTLALPAASAAAVAATPAPAAVPTAVPAKTAPAAATSMSTSTSTSASIEFAHNRSTLNAAARSVVQALAKTWQAASQPGTIQLQASADDSGRGLGNTALVRARANAVAKALRAAGVAADKIALSLPTKPNAALGTTPNRAPDPAKRTVMATLTP